MCRIRCAALSFICLLASCSVIDVDQPNVDPTAEPTVVESPTPRTTGKSSPSAPAPDPTSTQSPPSDDEEVISSLDDLSFPLETRETSEPVDDLGPFKDMVADATLVGLGESTHGTHEFVTIRRRMVRLLIEDMEFTHLVFEAPWAGIEVVNRYVHGEIDDKTAAQESLSYFMLRNEEVWDLIEWVREFNLSAEPSLRVQIVGVDPQGRSREASRIVLDFIESVDPGAYDDFSSFYSETDSRSESGFELVKTGEAFDMLANRRDDYTELSSEEAYEYALQAARVIYQSSQAQSRSVTEGYRLREQFMADNIDWVRQHAQSDSRMVLWGHNSHISKENPYTLDDVRSLGGLLDDRYGEEYFTVGFDFAEGSFTARHQSDMETAPTTFTIDRTREDAYADLLQDLEASAFMLHLRVIDTASPAGRWLAERRAMWSIGCCYHPMSDPLIYTQLVEAFDVLVFVRHTTPTRLLRDDWS